MENAGEIVLRSIILEEKYQIGRDIGEVVELSLPPEQVFKSLRFHPPYSGTTARQD